MFTFTRWHKPVVTGICTSPALHTQCMKDNA